MNPLHASQTAFYVIGSITMLAHLLSFVYRGMKIAEMISKRKKKISKQKTPLQKLRRRLNNASSNVPRKIS